MKAFLIILCGIALSGCSTLGQGGFPKEAAKFTQNFKADELNLTISSPAFNMNINAKGYDSQMSGEGIVNDKATDATPDN